MLRLWYVNHVLPTRFINQGRKLIPTSYSSHQKKVIASVTRLDQPLCTLAIDIYDPKRSTDRATYMEPRPAVLQGAIKQLESIVIPDSESTDANPHQYPAFIRIHDLAASYRLGRSEAGGVRYIRMNRVEVENLVSTLPGGEDARLW